jgi:hypothetical protein
MSVGGPHGRPSTHLPADMFITKNICVVTVAGLIHMNGLRGRPLTCVAETSWHTDNA